MKEYDENEAIDFIRDHIGFNLSEKYTDDDLIEVIDLTFDYFEQFSDDEDIDMEITVTDSGLALTGEDAEGLYDYVRHIMAKDKNGRVAPEDIPAIVTGEILYEDSLS